MPMKLRVELLSVARNTSAWLGCALRFRADLAHSEPHTMGFARCAQLHLHRVARQHGVNRPLLW